MFREPPIRKPTFQEKLEALEIPGRLLFIERCNREFREELKRNPGLVAWVWGDHRNTNNYKRYANEFLFGLEKHPEALIWVPDHFISELLRVDPRGFLKALKKEYANITRIPLEERLRFLLEHSVDVEENYLILSFLPPSDYLKLVSREFLLNHLDDPEIGSNCRKVLL